MWFGNTMELRMKVSVDKTAWLHIAPTNEEDYWQLKTSTIFLEQDKTQQTTHKQKPTTERQI